MLKNFAYKSKPVCKDVDRRIMNLQAGVIISVFHICCMLSYFTITVYRSNCALLVLYLHGP